MSGVSGVGSTLTQQLYQKLFDRLNLNGDDAVSLEEMSGLGAGKTDVSRVFSTLDADSDGRLTKAEMTPSDVFGAETLDALIQAQVGENALSDEEYLADWFARTDTDGDGLVSKDERQAAGDLRRAAAYDTGYASTRGLVTRAFSDDTHGMTIEDFRVVTLNPVNMPLQAIHSAESLPPDIRARLERIRELGGQASPLLTPETAEQRQARTEQMEADRIERDSGPEGAYRLLSRQIDDLRNGEAARIASGPLSDAMAAQMFQQILTGWNGAPTVTSTA